MKITIRKVLPEDAYNYAVLHINCWKDAYTGIIPDTYLENMSTQLEQRTERSRQNISNPDGCEYLCAVANSKMIGRLVYSKCRNEDKLEAGEINAIYLLANYWGKGYGKQIMDYAISKLKQANYPEVIVWVLEENYRARSFYEKYGFILDGTHKDIEIGKTLVEVRYTLDLTK
ncbi:MAG: GNAT family N-acetyltransferase [Oscillospiraceae bacterium]|jgi:L-amino acid N-acyltransferase YncA|nr:GNAT family N-acetyltransferase [Oscillospiraceae bacterium]